MKATIITLLFIATAAQAQFPGPGAKLKDIRAKYSENFLLDSTEYDGKDIEGNQVKR